MNMWELHLWDETCGMCNSKSGDCDAIEGMRGSGGVTRRQCRIDGISEGRPMKLYNMK